MHNGYTLYGIGWGMGDYGNLEENEPEYQIDLWADGKKSAHDRVKQMTLVHEPGITQAYIYKPLIQVIDLFCGGGGFTQGAINAGCQVVLAVDCWQPALDIHEANNPDVPTAKIELGGSIIQTAIILRRSLKPGCHFHLHGSPPCQNISNASNGDPEEGMVLVRWFLDLVEYMQPDSWSMENVVPMAKRLPEGTPYVKLNSANFGVPQTRNRIFAGEGWVAEPTHTKEDWVSVLDALPYLEGELRGNDRVVSRRRKAGEEPQSYTPDRPAHTITQVQHIIEHKLEALGSNAKRDNDRSITEPSKTICGSGNQVGARIFEHKTVVNTDGCSKSISRRAVSVDRAITEPAKTIHGNSPSLRNIHLNTSGCTSSVGNAAVAKDRVITKPSKVIRAHHATLRDKPTPTKAVKIRSLTLQETAILQGFSSSMKIPYARKRDAWTVIGNAVCPPVAEAVMRGLL